VSFTSVFYHPFMRHTFIKYLMKNVVMELWNFFLTVKYFPNELNTESVKSFAELYKRFILEGAPESINISGSERNDLGAYFERISKCETMQMEISPKEALKNPLDTCLGDLKHHFQLFLTSKEAIWVLEANHKNSEVISQDPHEIIIDKIIRNFISTDEWINRNDFIEQAKSLCDPELLLNTYLSQDWMQTEKLEQKLRKSFRVEPLSDTAVMIGSTLFQQYNRNGFKVQIIILHNKRMQRFSQNFFSLLFGTQEPSGYMEYIPCLLIGPWIFQFDDSSLCIPKKLMSQQSIALVSDVDALLVIKDMDQYITKISKFVTHWNITKTYGKTSSVDFIHAFLKNLEIDVKIPNYLQRILESSFEGNLELKFVASPEFMKETKLAQKQTVFKTHSQLDQFVTDLDTNLDLTKIQERFPDEYRLLKNFDRTFWMNYFSLKNDYDSMAKNVENEDDSNLRNLKQKIQPFLSLCTGNFPDDHVHTCPFKNPAVTGSIMVRATRHATVIQPKPRVRAEDTDPLTLAVALVHLKGIDTPIPVTSDPIEIQVKKKFASYKLELRYVCNKSIEELKLVVKVVSLSQTLESYFLVGNIAQRKEYYSLTTPETQVPTLLAMFSKVKVETKLIDGKGNVFATIRFVFNVK
jgi:hypothetical protein